MRILFLATWFPVPADNGSKLRTAALLRSLCERQRVTLVGFDFATAEPDAPSDLLAQCEAVHTLPLDPFEVNDSGTLRQFLALSPLFARPIPAMSQLVQRLSAETDFDVVIASTETMAPYAFLLPEPTLRVLEEHNCLTRWLQERETGHGRGLSAWRYRLSTAKARRFEASLFKRFDLVTMVSQPDRDLAQALAPQTPVRMIQNGVDTDFNRKESM